MATYSTSGTTDLLMWNTDTVTYPSIVEYSRQQEHENIWGFPKEFLYPGLQQLIKAGSESEPLERQTMKGGEWRFKPSGTVEGGKVIGMIYKGSSSRPVGEWTATVYDLTDGVSIQDLITNPRKDTPNMRGLFQVFVVDPDSESIVVRTEVIAKSYDGAKLRVLKDTELEKDVEDYDVFAIRIGDVRKKKEVQEVKIVGS